MQQIHSTLESKKAGILSKPVSEFVPHSSPMVLLDEILDFEQNTLTAQFEVTAQSRFYCPKLKGIESWVGIEYMAQAVAALAGIRAYLVDQPVKLGFLLGTRHFEIHKTLFAANQTYRVVIAELFMDDSGLGAFDCSILHNETLVCQAKLNVFESNDTNQLLN
ncbi:ApeP family dehydratase [Kangiella koreensis]|uniref:Beta-hydroxyacyl-(Acyl-carrier-protein) dehydratase FabA/FabZ n=1 Tax=Kangiella koreensis (strain DSM 16069 / JCM 12317 / KCTC 12182 / SW-125) TaxID=523791 RepID=C7R9X6_KANKD|nr:beta-hydroxyacyl-ACP dehydratase [Kangiella koreensis]ACV27995.1 Beta-hydroxyacyl-(acyl-carrier-protein) dehydratase FabA/FabZ [Kangiella koreensis DSM 16069]